MAPTIVRPPGTGPVGPVSNKGTQHTGWKLNQELLATVISNPSRGKLLRIEGNTYTPLQGLQAEPGKTLQLRVTALAPFIELALLGAGRITDKPGISPALVLSEKLLQRANPGAAGNASGLLRIVNLLDSLPAQAMSATTAALFAALKQRIVGPGSLVSPRTLRPALRDASLLLAGTLHPDDAGAEDGDLKSLLLQIVRSFAHTASNAHMSPGQGKLPILAGLALYQSVSGSGVELVARAAREVEEEFLRMFLLQKSVVDQTDEQGQRWLFELPFRLRNRIRSVSIHIYEEKRKQRAAATATHWAVKFGFELPHCGSLEIDLAVTDPEIAVAVACERVETANLLGHHQQVLRDKLAAFGLQMSALRCETRPRDSFATAQPPKSADGTAPVTLTKLVMHRNSGELPPLSPIPGLLYCTMASIFGFVLEIEEALSQ